MFRHIPRNIDLEQKILTVPCEEVMEVKRYVHIEKDGHAIALSYEKCLYTLIPKEIRDKFKELYNFDLLKKRKDITLHCELVDEAFGKENIENENFEAKLIYTLRKKKTNIEKTVARAKL